MLKILTGLLATRQRGVEDEATTLQGAVTKCASNWRPMTWAKGASPTALV